MGNPPHSIRHPGRAAKRQLPGIRALGNLEKPRFAPFYNDCFARRRPQLSQTGSTRPRKPRCQ